MTNLLPLLIFAVCAQEATQENRALPIIPKGDSAKYRADLQMLPYSMAQLSKRSVSDWRKMLEDIFEHSVPVRKSFFLDGKEFVGTEKPVKISFERTLNIRTMSGIDQSYVSTIETIVDSARIDTVAFAECEGFASEVYEITLFVEDRRHAVEIKDQFVEAGGKVSDREYTGTAISVKLPCSDKEADSLASLTTWLLRVYSPKVMFTGESTKDFRRKEPRWFEVGQ